MAQQASAPQVAVAPASRSRTIVGKSIRIQKMSSDTGSVRMMPEALFTRSTNQSDAVQKMNRRSIVALLLNRRHDSQVDGEQQDEAPEEERASACPQVDELVMRIPG